MKSMIPNNFGKTFLVDECPRITVSDLLNQSKALLLSMLANESISVSGLPVKLVTSRTGFNGVRYWFSCPRCQRRVAVVFKHPLSNNLGCRTCLGLNYRKRRYKGMVENDLQLTE